MAGTLVIDRLEASSAAQLVIENGVANTPPTIVDSNGTQIGTFCRAWVNFNGTGTVAILTSFNVSSITDNGVGLYTVNLTNAMPDTNYTFLASATYPGATYNHVDVSIQTNSGSQTPTQKTTSALNIAVVGSTQAVDALFDSAYICCAFFR